MDAYIMIARNVRRIAVFASLGFFALFGVMFLSGRRAPHVRAVEGCSENDIGCISAKIEEYRKNIKDLQNQQKTLASTIAYLDTKIKLAQGEIRKTELEIAELEQQIEGLSTRIGGLEISLDRLTDILLSRIQQNYKLKAKNTMLLLLASDGFSDFLKKVRYIQLSQAYTHTIIEQTESQKVQYAKEKQTKEEKQQEVELLKKKLVSQKSTLDQQKGQKTSLLAQTKNDEKKFQELLAAAQAEYNAIQAILAGTGKETKVGSVDEGTTIASMIPGASCNSSGGHVHFIVRKNKVVQNPFGYLKDTDHSNCTGGGACSEGDPWNPSGSWRWPLEGKITFSQGYGETWAVRNTWVGRVYSFHNGLDIKSASTDVRAVQKGTLYRGSYSGSGGCQLRYVRVEHEKDGMDTFYLHVNYVL